MNFFKNQAGITDVIVIIIIFGILGSIFITGVFVWKEIDNNQSLVNLLASVNQPVSDEVEEDIQETLAIFPGDYILSDDKIPDYFTLVLEDRANWTSDLLESANQKNDLDNFYAGIIFDNVDSYWSDTYIDDQEKIRIDMFKYFDYDKLKEDASALIRQEKRFTDEKNIAFRYYRNTDNVLMVVTSDKLDSESIEYFAAAAYLYNDNLGFIRSDSNIVRYTEGVDTYSHYGEKLLLSGVKTDFVAHKFEEQGYILFVDDEGILKTIDMEEPYTQSILAENVEMSECQDTDGLYLCEIRADGPGYLIRILLLDPETKEFVYVRDGSKGFYAGATRMFSSSFSDDMFYAYFEGGCNDGSCIGVENLVTIDASINNANYNKEQYLADVDGVRTLFECRFDYDPISKGYGSEDIDVENFPPDRLDCYSDGELLGYIDLINSEFVLE